jgi:ABC-type Co2+ transport system permease subunit
MHIEPGLVTGAKLLIGYTTAAAALTQTARLALGEAGRRGAPSLVARSAITTALVLGFFQLLPHHPVGVSEVHLILGSTLFLLFGAAPAAIGLALGLLIQGLAFAPFDLPQYGMNVSTLLFPLFAGGAVARRIIAPQTPYVDLRYGQALKLSLAYQGGVVGWVAFWALLGGGASAANLAAILSFGGAYMLVVLIEPLADLAVLAAAKSGRRLQGSALLGERLHRAA